MPTPRSLGYDLTLQKCKDPNSKKLAIVAGWMGAKQRQLKPYISFYHQRGYNVLSYAVGPIHVLKPLTATAMMDRVINIAVNGEDNNIDTKPNVVVMHCFSVGGYLTGQMLRILDKEDRKEDKQSIHKLVKAQIYDSPPDMRSIPNGVGASIGMGPIVSKVVASIIRSYLYIVRNTVGVEHKASSDAFHQNHIPAPSLWFYSKSDPVALEEDINTVINKWNKNGRVTSTTIWEDSPHIQHARIDPERYFGSLAGFIDKHIGSDNKQS